MLGSRSRPGTCRSCRPTLPSLDLIERLWKFTKRRALYSRYHPAFRDFQAAIQEILDGWSTRYFQQPAWLMTLNFQQFDDLSLMAARV